MSQSSPPDYGEKIDIKDLWAGIKFEALPKMYVISPKFSPTKSYGDPTDAWSRLTALQEEVVRRLFEALPVYWQRRGRDLRDAIVQYNDSGRTPREIAEWYERALVLR